MPLSYEDAQQLILAQIQPLAAETVPLREALGRAVAVAVIHTVAPTLEDAYLYVIAQNRNGRIE
jgi:molybdopterin biosynthesis enzyme